MAQVRVWNENEYEFSQEFKGTHIKIPAKKFIVMEDDDAALFYGSFSPIWYDGNDVQDPRSYKKLRIEQLNAQEMQKAKSLLNCHACGYAAPNNIDLDDHIKANHAGQSITDDEAELAMKTRGRGRPPKAEATA